MQPAALTKKVLVVDDEPEERILFPRLLGPGGYEPIPASTAGEGFHKAPGEGPDAIVAAVMFDQKGHLPLFHDLKLNADLTHMPAGLLSSIYKETLCQLRAFPGVSRSGCLSRSEGVPAKPPEADDLPGLLHTLTQTGAPERPVGL